MKFTNKSISPLKSSTRQLGKKVNLGSSWTFISPFYGLNGRRNLLYFQSMFFNMPLRLKKEVVDQDLCI